MCWSLWLKTLNLWHSWSWHTDALEKSEMRKWVYFRPSGRYIPSWSILSSLLWDHPIMANYAAEELAEMSHCGWQFTWLKDTAVRIEPDMSPLSSIPCYGVCFRNWQPQQCGVHVHSAGEGFDGCASWTQPTPLSPSHLGVIFLSQLWTTQMSHCGKSLFLFWIL